MSRSKYKQADIDGRPRYRQVEITAQHRQVYTPDTCPKAGGDFDAECLCGQPLPIDQWDLTNIEANAFFQLGSLAGRGDIRTQHAIAAVYWLGAGQKYGEVRVPWPELMSITREHIIELLNTQDGEPVPNATARLSTIE